MTVEAVLFDVDDTLLDTNYWHVAAWQQAFAEVGRPQPGWRLHAAIGLGGDRLPAAVAGDDAEREVGDDVRAAWKAAYDGMVDRTVPFAGAADLLRALADDGRKVVLASSGNPDHLAYARRALDVDDVLAGALSGEDVDSSKPAPDLFTQAWDLVDRCPAVVVGDTRWDVAAARDAGLPAVAVLTGGRPEQELRAAGALDVAEGPADLPAKIPNR